MYYLNEVFQSAIGILTTTAGHYDAIASILVASAIGATIAALAGMAPSIVQGLAVGKAVEAIGRQPEAAGQIRSTLIVGLAITETGGIYGVFVALLLVLFNPFVNMYVDAIQRL